MDYKQIESKPLTDLGFTADFCRRAHQMNLSTIGDIVQANPKEMIAKLGFSYAWLKELTDFLSRNDLLHKIQDIPGKMID